MSTIFVSCDPAYICHRGGSLLRSSSRKCTRNRKPKHGHERSLAAPVPLPLPRSPSLSPSPSRDPALLRPLTPLPTYYASRQVEMGTHYKAEALTSVLDAIASGEITKTGFDDYLAAKDEEERTTHDEHDIETLASNAEERESNVQLPGMT